MAELVDFIFVIVEVCPSGLGLLGQLCVDVCEQFLVLNQFFFVHLVDIVVVDENVWKFLIALRVDGLIGLHDVYQNHLELFFLMIDLLLDLLEFLDYFGVGLSDVLPQFLQ